MLGHFFKPLDHFAYQRNGKTCLYTAWIPEVSYGSVCENALVSNKTLPEGYQTALVDAVGYRRASTEGDLTSSTSLSDFGKCDCYNFFPPSLV